MAEARVVEYAGDTVLVEVEVDRSAMRALAIAEELRLLSRELGSLGYAVYATNITTIAEELEHAAIEQLRGSIVAAARAALRKIAASQFREG